MASNLIDNGKFLGVGAKFPWQITTRDGSWDVSGGATSEESLEHIRDSIRQILFTEIGERFYRRDFGSKLRSQVFMPIGRLLFASVKHDIFQTLAKWEPRIDLLTVGIKSVDPDGGSINLFIEYKVISQDVVANMVLPFALNREAF